VKKGGCAAGRVVHNVRKRKRHISWLKESRWIAERHTGESAAGVEGRPDSWEISGRERTKRNFGGTNEHLVGEKFHHRDRYSETRTREGDEQVQAAMHLRSRRSEDRFRKTRVRAKKRKKPRGQ